MVKIQVIVGPFPKFELQVRVLSEPEELQKDGIKAVEKAEKLLKIISERIKADYGLEFELEDVVEYHVDKENLGNKQVVQEYNFDVENI